MSTHNASSADQARRSHEVLGAQPHVTHAELFSLAKRHRCAGIGVEPAHELCRPEKNFWIFKATVYKSPKCPCLVGFGDSHPGYVSPMIFNHAEMRMAKTRAVHRAICLLERTSNLAPLARADFRVLAHPLVPTAVSERSSACGPRQFVTSSECGQHYGGPEPKKSEKMPICNVYLWYRARRRRGRWGRRRPGEWAGREGAMAR